jgi:choice-of-anchor B domain-containing protein
MRINRTVLLSIILLITNLALAQTPCEDGMAGNYPCQGIDLLSHISAKGLKAQEHQGIWLNDIWGWTDPDTNKEYAVIGMSNGTSFVDVTDPVNPVFLGILNEHNFSGKSSESKLLHDGAKSVWRDIKVYQNHAFIVSEDTNHGMQVFDLTELRGVTTPQTFNETAIYKGVGRAHNIVINEETGFAYIVGAATQNKTCTEGGLHIVDISTPASPVYRACFDTDGYTHDSQCVIYNGPDTDYQGLEICFNLNENSITLVNVSDKDNITMISKKGYTNSEYAHQGWLTEDQKYFLTNDELDERNLNTNTKTLIWDVQDLDNPLLIGTYEHEGKSIDHNLYIVDNLVYQSNYTSGLRVLKLNDVSSGTLTPMAFFDSYPASDATSFDGNWSNYPFFKSGTIILSDISNGLFVLKLSAATAPDAEFTFLVDGNQVQFTNETLSSQELSYEWDFGDGSTTNNEKNPTHIYTKGGSYEVKLKSTNDIGTTEITKTVTFVYTAIHSDSEFKDLKIYPNPSSAQLSIDLGKPSFSSTVTITDLKGKSVITQLIGEGSNIVTIDVNDLPHGMYYLTIVSDNSQITKKLVIN